QLSESIGLREASIIEQRSAFERNRLARDERASTLAIIEPAKPKRHHRTAPLSATTRASTNRHAVQPALVRTIHIATVTYRSIASRPSESGVGFKPTIAIAGLNRPLKAYLQQASQSLLSFQACLSPSKSDPLRH
ncbi:MAG: hypothetical protein ACE5FA_06455, partial [Dehalococcoidia bacterium]